MHRRMVFAFAILVGLATVARASSTLDVGRHFLIFNQNGGAQNTISIYLSGNDTNIEGINVNVQVADGGPLVNGSIVGPGVTGNLLAPGALFATDNTGIADLNPGQTYGNQLVMLQTTTNPGTTVSDVGGVLLMTLTFDTTGFGAGIWPLLFSGTVNGDTSIGGPQGIIPLDITNGFIGEPEPNSLVLALLAAGGFAVWSWRRRATLLVT